jgi:hypothetical protein
MSPGRLAYSMMLSSLKLIGVDRDDLVIVACDGRNNWRKLKDVAYKGTRKQKLEDSEIDWKSVWKSCDELLERLDISTNWHIIKIDKLEADDIMAVGARYFWNKEVVLVTYDSDLEQCWHYNTVSECCKAPVKTEDANKICCKCHQITKTICYNRVKIFSQHPKAKRYKTMPDNFNVYEVLAKKTKQEKTDDLISEVQNEEEFDIRTELVDLIHLPNWVKEAVKDRLRGLSSQKPSNLSALPFYRYGKLDRWGKSGIDSFNEIYGKERIITYEQSKQMVEVKKQRKARKATREKAKAKKAAIVARQSASIGDTNERPISSNVRITKSKKLTG